MDRRDFLKKSVAGMTLAAGVKSAEAQDVYAGVIIPGEKYSDGRAGDVSNAVEDHLKVEGYVKEPSHRIPVVLSADVVVVGGGPGGVAAAISAAREGASVCLIEKTSYLGGLWTGGLVLPVLATHARDKSGNYSRAIGGICKELCDELLKDGWAVNEVSPRVDPEATKYLLDKVVQEAGIRVIYNATAAGVTMSGNRVESVLLDCNTGRLAVKCKMAVDASGDGCLFNWTGDPFESRRYHISTSYLMGGCKGKKMGGGVTPNEDMKFATIGTRAPEDGLDVFRVSDLLQRHRIDLWDRIEKLRQQPETKDVYLMEVARLESVSQGCWKASIISPWRSRWSGRSLTMWLECREPVTRLTTKAGASPRRTDQYGRFPIVPSCRVRLPIYWYVGVVSAMIRLSHGMPGKYPPVWLQARLQVRQRLSL